MEKEITTILENTETSPSNIYFTEDDIKYAIKISNKNSAPGPDRITTELIEHGGETLTKSITLLMQASYSIGYIPEEWKRENKIYIKKTQNKLPSREFIFLLKTLKYWVGVQRGQSYLMGRRCLFSLGWPPF